MRLPAQASQTQPLANFCVLAEAVPLKREVLTQPQQAMKFSVIILISICFAGTAAAELPAAAELERRIAELEQTVADLQWQVADQAETLDRYALAVLRLEQQYEGLRREWWKANNAAAHWQNCYVKCFQEKVFLIDKLQRLGY